MVKKQFEYGEITKREGRHSETIYSFDVGIHKGFQYYSLMTALLDIGESGWELVGEIEGKLIAKREILVEDDE